MTDQLIYKTDYLAATGVVEAGHYYEVTGPTAESVLSWQIGKNVAAALIQNPQMMHFLDDVHGIDEMFGDEATKQTIEWAPDEGTAVVLESETEGPAIEMIHALSNKEKLGKKAAKKNGGGRIYLSDFPLTTKIEEGEFDQEKDPSMLVQSKPTCVAYDAALTLFFKADPNLPVAINVLHERYTEQQQQLHEVVARATVAMEDNYPYLNEHQIITVLFDDEGVYHVMQPTREFAAKKWHNFLAQNNLLINENV